MILISKFGQGSTSQILGMEDRRGAEGNSFAGRVLEQLTDVTINKDESVRELLHLIGE